VKREIVCKFGGSSVENASQVEKVKNIVQDNKNRRYVVVSAPGRDETYRIKITDHLINIADNGKHLSEANIDVAQSKKMVLLKFETLCHELQIGGTEIISALKEDFNVSLQGEKRKAYLSSRGEHYSARVIADYFNQCGMPTRLVFPEEIGFSVSEEFLSAKVLEESYANLETLKSEERICLMPGYYGITPKGDIAVLSRGGSDLTGGEIAYSVNASLYENWSDIDGVYEVDPRIINDADVVPRLTFKEIRLLSTKGFNVFHFDAMINCKKCNIPINIRNTNRPSASGTMILNERVPVEEVVGIAKLDNMAYIYLEKEGLGEEIGFTEGLLGIFNKYKINTYHYPTDKDDIAVLLNKDDLSGNINNLRQEIEEQLNPDVIDVVYDLAILSMVGIGMRNNSFAIADAVSVLKNNHIDIEMIDQGPAKISFHIGVAQHHADHALQLLHQRLILES